MDGDVHADGDVDAHADVAHAPGIGHAFAQLLGLGKVPLSVSLMVLCYSVGLIGWMSNKLIAGQFDEPARFFPVSLLIALVGGLVVLRGLTMVLARYAPSYFSSAMSPRQLVGLVATTSLPVNERIGRASLYDRYGTLHVVECRVRDGADGISKGQSVVLVKYVPERDMYIVGRAK
jgi:hypothetical protein